MLIKVKERRVDKNERGAVFGWNFGKSSSLKIVVTCEQRENIY